jgi:CheY-like chemotaxis protein
MSGFTEEDAVSRFAGKGLAGFLQKPFSPSDLAEELRRVLESAPPVHP